MVSLMGSRTGSNVGTPSAGFRGCANVSCNTFGASQGGRAALVGGAPHSQIGTPLRTTVPTHQTSPSPTGSPTDESLRDGMARWFGSLGAKLNAGIVSSAPDSKLSSAMDEMLQQPMFPPAPTVRIGAAAPGGSRAAPPANPRINMPADRLPAPTRRDSLNPAASSPEAGPAAISMAGAPPPFGSSSKFPPNREKKAILPEGGNLPVAHAHHTTHHHIVVGVSSPSDIARHQQSLASASNDNTASSPSEVLFPERTLGVVNEEFGAKHRQLKVQIRDVMMSGGPSTRGPGWTVEGPRDVEVVDGRGGGGCAVGAARWGGVRTGAAWRGPYNTGAQAYGACEEVVHAAAYDGGGGGQRVVAGADQRAPFDLKFRPYK